MRNRRNFSFPPEALEGRVVCVRGVVSIYRGVPEIESVDFVEGTLI